MRTVSLRNLAAHKVRLALTVISVLLGTAFVAGSFVFTDTLKGSFDTIFNTSSKGIDARVQAKHDYDPGVPTSVIPAIRAVPGAATVEPKVQRNGRAGRLARQEDPVERRAERGRRVGSALGQPAADLRERPRAAQCRPGRGQRRRGRAAQPAHRRPRQGRRGQRQGRQRDDQRHLPGRLRHRRLRRRAVHPGASRASVHRRQPLHDGQRRGRPRCLRDDAHQPHRQGAAGRARGQDRRPGAR